ncbi:MAG: LPS export ABC transporter periplasmic protein LptC [Thermodesulfobacteriota bacterium]
MRKKITFLVVITAIVSLTFLGAKIWNMLKPLTEEQGKPNLSSPKADLELKKVKYTETREGVKEWELEAFSVGYFQEEGIVVCEKVKATFFGQNEVSYTLTGLKGKFHMKTKIIEVSGGVKIDSTDGYHLRSPSIKYLAEKRELVTADLVQMEGPRLRVEGQGMIVDIDRQRVKILNQVSTVFADIDIKGNKINL